MNATSKMAPALRFPGFQSDWWKEPLHNLTEKSITYGIVQTGDAVEGGVKCVRVVDLTKSKIILDELITTTEEISRSYKRTILVEGEIMIALRGEIGLLALVPKNLEGSNLTRGIARVAPKRIAVNPEYLVWALRSDDGKMEFLKQVNGSALKEIPINGLNKVQVQLTSLAEQRKIADFLTAVDGRIQQLSQKKALLEDYKKGVIQQLFTQALRFKDDHGNEFPDWEEKTLGEAVAEIKSGLSLDQNTDGTGFKVTRIETISDRTINLDKVGYVETDKNIADFRLLPGDILFSNINSVSHIGKVAFVDRDYDLYQGMNLLRIRCGSKSEPSFLFQMLTSVPFVQYFQRICNQAVSQASINQTDLKKTPLTLPSVAEQRRIANFLTALDRKIESVANQITHTQAFKKGLLQQMFV